MKMITASIAALVSFHSFAGSYGFMNQDVSGNICFVGVDESTSEYAGVVSQRFLSERQLQTMENCMNRKAEGKPAVIHVHTTPDTQVQPNGVTTHFPKFHVSCVNMKERQFGEFLNAWRNQVRNSNFRRCF
jgi:hypothetical protein